MQNTIPFNSHEIITLDELTVLRELSYEIGALRDFSNSLHSPTWRAAATQARIAFRVAPSVSRAEALLALLALDPEHSVNQRS